MTPDTKSEAKTASKAGFAELFLEIGCEEIPAGMIANAARELQVILNKYLGLEKLLDGAEVSAFGAPRRGDARTRPTGSPTAVRRPARSADSRSARRPAPRARSGSGPASPP